MSSPVLVRSQRSPMRQRGNLSRLPRFQVAGREGSRLAEHDIIGPTSCMAWDSSPPSPSSPWPCSASAANDPPYPAANDPRKQQKSQESQVMKQSLVPARGLRSHGRDTDHSRKCWISAQPVLDLRGFRCPRDSGDCTRLPCVIAGNRLNLWLGIVRVRFGHPAGNLMEWG